MILWGQSAGGNAANSYGYAYPSDPIVAGIVAQSGTVAQLNSANTTAFTLLAKKFGCDAEDAGEELACMQAVPNDVLHGVIKNGGTDVPRFSPVVDGVTLYANNTARLEEGLVADVVSRPTISQLSFDFCIGRYRENTDQHPITASHPRQHCQRRRRFRSFRAEPDRTAPRERYSTFPAAGGVRRRG